MNRTPSAETNPWIVVPLSTSLSQTNGEGSGTLALTVERKLVGEFAVNKPDAQYIMLPVGDAAITSANPAFVPDARITCEKRMVLVKGADG